MVYQPAPYLLAVVGFVGTWGIPGKGVKLGRNPRKVQMKSNPPLNVLVQSVKSGCKRTIKIPLSFIFFKAGESKRKHQQVYVPARGFCSPYKQLLSGSGRFEHDNE